jgi:hypothetical protein
MSSQSLKKLASIPMPDGRTPEQKAKNVETCQSPVDRAKDIDNVLTWLRTCGVELEDDDTPFKPQLPGAVNPHRSPEDR